MPGPSARWDAGVGVVKNYFQLREFSFTLRDDVYLRFQSFSSPQELERELQKINPYKIDIGAVYSHRPNQHNTVHLGAFQPQEKELVFDIDMTDYDDVRTCCSSADICSKCWTLMTIAVRIIDRALVEDLGVRHRLWVYSGRRGVHCWVCDDAVRKWSPALRAAAVEYLSLVKGGADTVKKVTLSHPVHPFIRRSVAVVQEYFERHALLGQDILGSPERWDRVLALLPEELREPLQAEFPRKKDSVQRWELLRARAERERERGRAGHPEWEVMLQLCFPRLDCNVSKGLGHLLKSPFSVHPKTGRISVPLDLQRLEEFDPFSVPTITSLCQELDAAGSDGEQEEGGDTEPKRRMRAPPHALQTTGGRAWPRTCGSWSSSWRRWRAPGGGSASAAAIFKEISEPWTLPVSPVLSLSPPLAAGVPWSSQTPRGCPCPGFVPFVLFFTQNPLNVSGHPCAGRC
ncbi:DNA primase small subunit isoform X2 [Haemorhous mexicanus]|uniref:DNA primase small subunit isoform X2 n=1 Tax=Haemorhous mexicanus TaxID=30427 RepID=UPI0028BE899B|nr:DNA primase small subunit isoform X2 [Haemorhous mexicanus]